MIVNNWIAALGSEYRADVVHRHSMYSFQEFINKIAEKEGYRAACEIDAMMEGALKESAWGRIILWCVSNKHFRGAAFLSRFAGFSLEMQPDRIWGSHLYRVKLHGKVIAAKEVSLLERVTG